jgi:hypothetical protein
MGAELFGERPAGCHEAKQGFETDPDRKAPSPRLVRTIAT